MPSTTVLQIIPRLDTGGAEKSTLEITQALSTAGAAAIVATRGGRMVRDVEWAGGEIVEFPADTKVPTKILGNVKRLAKLIIERNVDLIHARSRAPAWTALLAARRTGCAFVTTYHGAYSRKNIIKNIYNSVMARGDLVIANSEFTANLIRQNHGISEERIRVIHRGVNLADFNPTSIGLERMERIRSNWGVRLSQNVVLHAARLTGWKGQRVVIEAAAELNRRGVGHDCVFILAGDAQGRQDYVDELNSMIAKHNLEEKVKLVGHCEDMAAAFACAHVAAVASTEPEAFGRAATEAQAIGCPVIVTDLGAVPETVLAPPDVPIEQATGWRIKPNDPHILADALAEALCMRPIDRKAMGGRARNHIISRFSLDQMRYATLQVYDELIGSRLASVYSKRYQREQRISMR